MKEVIATCVTISRLADASERERNERRPLFMAAAFLVSAAGGVDQQQRAAPASR
jgi:hypothetical protein